MDNKGKRLSYAELKAKLEEVLLKNKELTRSSLIDCLTGLKNRRAILEDLKVRFSEVKRYKRSFWLVFIDLDGFKFINDTYGHSVGDEALILFSKLASDEARVGDTLSRYGGDEFAFVFSDTEEKGVGLFINRLQKKLKENTLRCKENTDECIEFSWGAIEVTSGNIESIGTTKRLIELVDGKMYEHKESKK